MRRTPSPHQERSRSRARCYPLKVESLERRELLADGITASGASPISAQPGVPITNAVFATYSVSDSSGQPGTQWRAKINFGDGQSDKKLVPVLSGNDFQLVDSHTYQTAGTYTVTIMIAIPGSHRPNDNDVTTQVVVVAPTPSPSPNPPPPTPTPKPPPPTPKPQFPSSIGSFGINGMKIQAKIDKTYFGYIGYFHEPRSEPSNFHALVNWGDGSKIKPAHVQQRRSDQYGLQSSHRYVKPGVFHVIILLSDGRNRKVVTVSLVHVLR